MALTSGTKLGPYEIRSPLGAGGMGEVYRARDTRLDRFVAIKILHSHLSCSPELKTRFEREARTLSCLSHPHICSLYDVGRDGDVEFLVMELLEGETLSARLQRGPLTVSAAVKLGIEIADALAKAHRLGVIHRDLKPSNIMLTANGAKLMISDWPSRMSRARVADRRWRSCRRPRCKAPPRPSAAREP